MYLRLRKAARKHHTKVYALAPFATRGLTNMSGTLLETTPGGEGAKLEELRHAGHGAVLVHDFADDAGGAKSGDARKINRCFGLACAYEHAAIARAQRKHVAGPR